MLEVYSTNATVTANAAIPLNNVSILKGHTVTNTGVSTIQFNNCGVYEVNVNATAIATSAGNISLQLYKNNTAQVQTLTTETAADTSGSHALSFATLVQVSSNNTPCPCSSPTVIQLMNVGVGATFSNIDVIVTKVV